jgi:hypothetical protein
MVVTSPAAFEQLATAVNSGSGGGVFSSLSSNPLFSAGIGLGFVGFGFGLFRKGAQQAAVLARRHCLVTLEIPSKDKSYHWVLQWITNHAKRTQHLSVGKSMIPQFIL